MVRILVCAIQSIHDIEDTMAEKQQHMAWPQHFHDDGNTRYSSSSANVVPNHHQGMHAAACLRRCPRMIAWPCYPGLLAGVRSCRSSPIWKWRWHMAGDELSLSGLAARKEGVASPVRPRRPQPPWPPCPAWAPISSAAGGQSALILLVHGGWDQNDTAKQVKGPHGDPLGL